MSSVRVYTQARELIIINTWVTHGPRNDPWSLCRYSVCLSVTGREAEQVNRSVEPFSKDSRVVQMGYETS